MQKSQTVYAFYASNEKDAWYLQLSSDAWGKCSDKHAANVASASRFKMDVINIEL